MSEGREPQGAVERILGELGTAQPPVGMEERVLTRLRQEVGHRAEPRAPHRLRWVWAMGLAVAAIVLTLLTRANGGGMLVPAEHGQVVESARAQEGSTRSALGSAKSGTDIVVNAEQRARVKVHPLRRAHALGVGATTQKEAASSETVSYPAPVMPLTRQERLLLRMRRSGEQSTLVATLSSEAERAMELHNGRQRLSFFAPPQQEREAERRRAGIQDDGLVVDPVGHAAPAINQSGTEWKEK